MKYVLEFENHIMNGVVKFKTNEDRELFMKLIEKDMGYAHVWFKTWEWKGVYKKNDKTRII